MAAQIVVLQTILHYCNEVESFLVKTLGLRLGEEVVITTYPHIALRELENGKGSGQLFITGTLHGEDPASMINQVRDKDPTVIFALLTNVPNVCTKNVDHEIDRNATESSKNSLNKIVLRYLGLKGIRHIAKRLKSKKAEENQIQLGLDAPKPTQIQSELNF